MRLTERIIRTFFLPMTRISILKMPLPIARRLVASGDFLNILPRGIKTQQVMAERVRCEWLIPDRHTEQMVLLYLHGGGFVVGWHTSHRFMLGHFARHAGIKALAVDYRLTPEHPYPAALEDCITAYRWLLKLRAEGDPLLSTEKTCKFCQLYAAGHELYDLCLSPLHGDLHDLPPLLIQVGSIEILRSDAEKARAAGVQVQLDMIPRMWHGWHVFVPCLQEAVDTSDTISRFIHSTVV